MGTRSIVKIQNDNGEIIACMYRQYDGYLSCAGKEYFEFINSGKVINGFSKGDDANFNGVGCFAAKMVARFKGNKIGGFYLHAPNMTMSECDAEFEYLIKQTNEGLELSYRTYEKADFKILTKNDFKTKD